MTIEERCKLLKARLTEAETPEAVRDVIKSVIAIDREPVPDSREARMKAFDERMAELPVLLAAVPAP